MNNWVKMTTAMTLATGVAALPASAGETEIVTLHFDLTEAPLAIFGLQWTMDYLVPAADTLDGQIVDARMHLEFNTEAGAGSLPDASLIEVQFQTPTENVPFWNVSGKDLGWSGTGSFTADVSTDELNKSLLEFEPDALVFWFARIVNLDDGAPQLGGQFTASYIEIDVEVPSETTPGDLNGDGAVNGQDLLMLLNAWGQTRSPADLDGDGTVAGGDLLILLNNWG